MRVVVHGRPSPVIQRPTCGCFTTSSTPSLTSVEFAIIGYDEHDFPLENIGADEPAAYSRYVLVALHLFELAAEQAGGWRSCHDWEVEEGTSIYSVWDRSEWRGYLGAWLY